MDQSEGPELGERSSLNLVLRWRGEHQSEQPAFVYLADGESETARLTYGALDRHARSVAAWLQARDLAGKPVLLLYRAGLEFVSGFIGCLYAGAIAVPAYPPHPRRTDPRLQSILGDCAPKAALCAGVDRELLVRTVGSGKIEVVATDELSDRSAEWQAPAIEPQTLAHLQYTSGSTGNPKGVMVSHGNLLHQCHYVRSVARCGEGSVRVTWQPFFHDMGLIAGVIGPLFCGALSIVIPPAAFLQSPIRWLRAISKYRAAGSMSPNFGYDLCVRGTTPAQREGLDLSCWKDAWNGAEPIRADTLDRFCQIYEPYGFRRHAFLPCYGMAETTLCTTASRIGRLPVVAALRREALDRGAAESCAPDEAQALRRVGSGIAGGDMEVAIVDPQTLERQPDGMVGEIWVAGPSVAQGYWQRPDETRRTFAARIAGEGSQPYLRTGDLGFVRAGELYVTGRLKDMIIVRGRNLYPQDIEAAAQASHEALQIDACGAFAMDVEDREELGIAIEVRRSERQRLDADEVFAAIRAAVAEQLGIGVHWIGLLAPGRLPKTSSGKVMRHACRQQQAAGELQLLAQWQAREKDDHAIPDQGVTGLLERLHALPQYERHRALVAHLQAEVARALELEAAPDPRTGFERLGIDSMAAVDLVNRLQEELRDRLALPATLLFDQPNIESVARYIEQALFGEPQQVAAPVEGGAALDDPIAVVGLACRFPGAPDADAFWQLLAEGRDAIREVPPQRWDIDAYFDPDAGVPGKMNSRYGGFIDDIAGFDAAFFDIAPREATSMDPQHRHLLEVSWLALENAGIAPAALEGRPVGVFVGISTSDYEQILSARGEETTDAFMATGNAHSAAVGRLSFLLGLQGPCVAVDTACSSSLVAVHQAVQSLRQGECEMALAGGVNAVLRPELTVAFCKARLLSPGGRCRTFDASADGYVRSEGCGMVVLKRLSDARRGGDRILALIRGSAINQDGRTSGLTAPSGPSQTRVIASALKMAGVEPAQVQYLECHGTATVLGDPIEVQAAHAILGQGRRPDEPLLIGSVKSNLGHLEAAAGIAGLIKVILALEHARIPPSLHFKVPNPHIPWAAMAVKVAAEALPWATSPGGTRIAGVSSFGFAGTNAHVVIEAAPGEPAHDARGAPQAGAEGPHLLAISARSEAALRDLAGRYEQWLQADAGADLSAVCDTANRGRNHFEHRAALICKDREAALRQLAALARGDAAPGLFTGCAPRERPRVAFLFPGQGLQYAGMARALYERVPAFRACVERCAQAYEVCGRADGSPALTDLMFDAGSEALLKQTRYVQPALYTLQVALAALWRSWGVAPAALLGHSAGEYAAACVAGVFDVEDGLRLIVERARLMQALPAGGAMLSITAPVEKVEAAIAGERAVHVSAYNGLNTVISGPAERLDALARQFDAQEIYYAKLPATNAFHSPSIEPILDDFEAFARRMAFGAPAAALVSTMTGRPLSRDDIPDAAYWREQARRPVRFAQAVRSLFEDVGCDIVLELGPQAELVWLAQMSYRPEHKVVWTSSLAKGGDAFAQVLTAAAQLHANGTTLDFAGMNPQARRPRRLALPTYPFRHERFWPGPMGVAASPELRDATYRVQWRVGALGPMARKLPAQGWLILDEDAESGAELAQALRARGQHASLAPPLQGGDVPVETICAVIEGARREAALDHVVLVAGASEAADPDAMWEAQDRGVVRALLVAKALVSARGHAQLWLVTRGALAVTEGEALDPTHAPIWGFGRTFALEHPDRCGGLIDIPPGRGSIAALADALLCDDGEKQAALRAGQRWLPRLEPYALPALEPVAFSDRGAYLIAGGTGAMGLAIARHLAARGAGQIVLTSRSGADDSAAELIRKLNASGCRVDVIRADLSVRSEVERLMDEIERIAHGRPLRGMVFAAGTHAGAGILRQTPESLRAVLAPKVRGAWNLHRVAIERGLQLDLFVLFSSGASLLGSREHANYTASNAFLDSLAHHRRSLGLPALVINWGPWAGLGVAVQMQGANWQEIGIRPIAPPAAMRMFDRLASGHDAQVAVQPLDLQRWIDLARSGRIPPILLRFLDSLLSAADIAPAPDARAAGPQTGAPAPGEFLVELLRLGPSERGPALQAFIRERVGAVLGIPAQQVDPDAGFFDMGMNSIMAVELRGALEAKLGRLDELQAAVVFNHPTVRRLSAHLASTLFASAPALGAGSAAVPALPAEVHAIETSRLPAAIDAAVAEVIGRSALKLPQGGDGADLPLRKAFAAILALRAQLQAIRSRAADPIAIVGLSCRYPGADSPDAYWEMLAQGRDEISDVPSERWDASLYYDPDPDAPGKMNSRGGGFLAGIEGFDPDFFGISHREALSMDPQQRLLLEVSWEALESANLVPRRLREARGGIFVGITAADYAQRLVAAGIENIDAYGGTGNALCAAAGRLAFTLGWRGPAMAIDTACSSSLVALHEACTSLRAGECDIALAGGVNLILDPAVSITLAKAHALSPDDRCKTFDANANGYVRSEGCGMLVLKRLSDAQRDGDRILALVRGSAVNQDGRSSGLTVPNGLAQEQVILDALKIAGVAPAAVQYLEAHGTGTPLGDPIEVQAADHVLSQGRDPASPLLIGSVKSNIGHTEAAAGAASVIKVVLALQHEMLPRTLHFKEPNPHIPWSRLKVKALAEPMPWPRGEGRRIAGVSSFGFVGTNAHVIVEEAPAPQQGQTQPAAQPPERGVRLLALSARSAQSLAMQATRYARWLERNGSVPLDDVCHTANVARDHFEHRASLVFEDRPTLDAQLAALAEGQDVPGLVRGRAAQRSERRIAFLFTGQGAQSVGMGRELYRIEPVFRECFDRCADEFARISADAPDLRQIVFEGAGEGVIDQTRYTQPALYALEVALAALWRAWGVEPTVVLGHSVGEYAAACTAEVFGVEEGLRLIAARGRLMQELPAGGGMLSVAAAAADVEAALEGSNDVCIAAYNGADTVVSGGLAELDALAAALEARGVRCRRLATSHAFHSARMEPILDSFRAVAMGVPYRPPAKRLISNVSGEAIAEDCVLDADYWTTHIRRPVQFERSIRALQQLGCDVLLEIGPHPVLVGLGQSCWTAEPAPLWVGSLRRNRADAEQMLAAAGAMYVAGVDLDFAAMDAPWRASRRKVDLPFYAFQRRRFWIDAPRPAAAISAPARLEECLHDVIWEQRDAKARTSGGARAETWLILADEGGVAATLRRQLEDGGRKCICITAAEVAAGSEQALAQAIEAAAHDAAMPLTHVVHLWSLDRARAENLDELWDAQGHGVESALDLVQALAARSWRGRLWLVTRGVKRVLESDEVNAVQSALWGFGVSVGMEHPELWGGLVDLPPGAAAADGLLAALDADDAEDQSALRDGRRWVARLERRASAPESRALPVEAEATYLITGGLGGVGLESARRLVQRGARRLVLTGRRPPAGSAQQVIAEIEGSGCQVKVVLADIALQADAARLLDEIRDANWPPLKGVLHAAGVDALVRLRDLDRARLRSVLAPKLAGAWLLDELLAQRGIELAWFVSTSSIASVWGSMGQAAYSAANAYLDALSGQRRARGRPATTVNYGPWSRVGMGTANEEGIAWLRSRGIRTLEPEFALDGMECAVAGGHGGTVVADINWTLFRQLVELQRQRPLFERLGSNRSAEQEQAQAPARTDLLERLEQSAPVERVQALKQIVKAELARVLRKPAEELDDDAGFFDMGMDSLMAVELINQLRQKLAGTGFSAALIQAHPSVAQLAAALAGEIAGAAAQAAPGSGDESRAQSPLATSQQGGDGFREAHYQLPDGVRYTHRRYRPGDKELVVESFEHAFGAQAASALATFFDWKYLENPLTPESGPIVDVLECDGRIGGMNGGVCVRFKFADTTMPGIWSCDSHVDPAHRRATTWFLTRVHETGPSVLLGAPNPAMYPFAAATGEITNLDELVDLRAAMDLGAVLASRGANPLLAWCCGLLYRPARYMLDVLGRMRTPRNVSVATIAEFDSRFDALWDAVAPDYPGIMVRDATFLAWRFDRCPGRHYTRYIAERNGRLVGYMVTRKQHIEGRRRGVIADFLVHRDDEGALGALVSRAMRDFAADGVDAVIFPIASSQREHIKRLRRHGFVLGRHRAHFIARKGPLLASIEAIDNWFFTFADGDGDYNETEADASSQLEGGAAWRSGG